MTNSRYSSAGLSSTMVADVFFFASSSFFSPSLFFFSLPSSRRVESKNVLERQHGKNAAGGDVFVLALYFTSLQFAFSRLCKSRTTRASCKDVKTRTQIAPRRNGSCT